MCRVWMRLWWCWLVWLVCRFWSRCWSSWKVLINVLFLFRCSVCVGGGRVVMWL